MPIGDLLGRSFQKNGMSRDREYRAVTDAWERVVPPGIGLRARPLAFRGGKLVVAVSSAPLLDELRCFRSGEFLLLLNQALSADAQSCGVQVRAVDFRRA
ncbi:MAG: DUF721 domain-containing protein [Planctomycetota bacterium]|nr:MAG: DUF721 domain-containing protein [Planctomycetota bacterium]